MHRRNISRLSRRLNFSSPTTPSPTRAHLRTFQSCAVRRNDSGDGDNSSEGTPAPRFGNKWASRQTQRSTGLSAAEQALREALKANNQPKPEPEPQRKPDEQQSVPIRYQYFDAPNRKGSSRRTRQSSSRRAIQREPQQKPDDEQTVPRRHEHADSPVREGSSHHARQPEPQRTPDGQQMVPIQHEYRDSPARERSSWRARQRIEPMGLSAAERASREALKAEDQPKPEPEPRQKPDDEQTVPIRYDYTDSTTRGGPSRRARWPESQRRKPDDEQTVRIRYNDVDAPLNEGPGLARLRKDMKRRATSPHSDSRHQKSDAVLRRGAWSCKNCGAKVRGHLATCPVCKTPGSAETAKFQELGRSILSEKREQFEREEDDLRGARPSLREEEPEKSSAESQEKEGKDKEAQWSWDMSALEQLETLEAQEEPATAQKKKKERREGRRQRQTEAEEADVDDDFQRLREERKRQKKEKVEKKKAAKAAPAPLYLPDFISVGNLADVIGVRPAQFVRRMEEMGFEEVTYEHVLDAETAGLVAAEYNYEAIFDQGSEDLKAAPLPEDTSNLPPRPPVVTIMGHVDHGKTTILDWLRKSSVAATEHGGITQHIGAFSVAMPSGKTITFLDTPGHSAFLEMRRRGADVTDIVVLVVAADDSVKPQTVEAIKHATQSNVPIIVAMSKIDKEGCNPDKVKQDLSVHGVHVEDYGGDVQAIAVSGKTGAGMIELEEAIGVLSEMLDHRAERDCNAEGWVLEATTKSYGRVASALIRRGTLRPGDIIVAGTTWARVRTLRNEAGVAVREATPGMPVEIDGWREQPAAGSEILRADTEQQAKDVVEYRLERSEAAKMGEDMTAINEARVEKRRLEKADSAEAEAAVAEKSGPKPVNFIIKADVDGSAEAVVNSIAAIGNNEVYANVLRSGVGPVGEFDIEHAATANGKVISFNMPIDASMLRMAEQEGVQILDHNIIYKLIDDIKAVLSEELPPTVTQRVTGEAEVQQVFEITIKNREKAAIAGCRVRNGMINKARKVRVVRGDETIYDGTITSLKHVKKDVTEMRKDTECGIGFEGWSDFAVGDHIQCYEETFEKRYL